MVGSSVWSALEAAGYENLIGRTSSELDLRDQAATRAFFEKEKPDVVVMAAAKVGGILANDTYRAEFLYDNLMIEANVVHAAHEAGVEKFLFLGSSCIYPKLAPQPLKEEYLLSDYLEHTNEPYAVAKIAGLKLCENYYRQYGDNFISAMPTNLFGVNDNFNLETSHVLPALMRKLHEANKRGEKTATIWGTGKPKREFLFVDDLADALVFLLENLDAKTLYDEMNVAHINVGSGEDLTILELAQTIADVVGFEGEIVRDESKPDGTPRKVLDVARLRSLGWEKARPLREGIEETYRWFLENELKITSRDRV
jgi:GDP-L-fucose synthase